MSALLGPQMAFLFDLEGALEDVQDQRALDRDRRRPPCMALIKARMRAVLLSAEHQEEPFGYRQALIDLAAVCMEEAARIERPLTPSRRVIE